ncbi:MAG: hypothetical protein ACK40G_18245 [Cytophagaceae bacterium]
MRKINKIFALAVSVISIGNFSDASAQNVYFSGVGRALVTNETLKDDTDPASKLKATGGYTIFDLGIYASPNEVLRGGVILRARNEFGGFFGQGAGFEFRQLQMEGIIAKKVKYELGDIYLTHTPYTLWNSENIYSFNKYESPLFTIRRDIVNYENFFIGNAWRMQGFNAKSKVNFTKGAESAEIRAYGGRTMPTNFLSIPDRYFYGGRVDVVQSKYFRIAGNLAGISDIAGTVKNASVNYENLVYTADFALTGEINDKFKLSFTGEAGASKFQLKRESDSLRNEFNDYFYDLGLKATHKPMNLTVGVSYRNVGFNFNSPMAQTRRIAQPGDIGLTTFPMMNNGLTTRPFTLFDPYVQETNFYNQSISTTLMNYLVQYDMVEPYGKATPNRKGFTFSADMSKPDELFNAGLDVSLLSEIVSEGDSVTQAKRKFTMIRGGMVFNVNKLLKMEKKIALHAGYRAESSRRDGTNPVNLSNSLMDLGMSVEVVKNLQLLGGVKLFNVKGEEIQNGRDELNQIVSFGPAANFNESQNIIAAGLRYDYDKSGYFSMHYHLVDFKNGLVPNQNMNMNQMFFVFGLKF